MSDIINRGGEHLSSSKTSFAEKLHKATNEDKQVNEIYKKEIKRQFNKLRDDETGDSLLRIDIDDPIYLRTDGIFQCSYLCSNHIGGKVYLPFYLLMECKLDKDFNIAEQKADVLLQVIAYLSQLYYCNFIDNAKQREKARSIIGISEDQLHLIEKMPSIVFVGSKTTCFAVNTDYLTQHYISDFDAIKSASTIRNTEIGKIVYNQIIKNELLDAASPVFDTSDKYCMQDIAEIIYKANLGIKNADDLSQRNLYKAFTRFTTRVLTSETIEKLDNRTQAKLFAQFIVNRKAIKQNKSLDDVIESLTVDDVVLNVNTREWNVFSWMYNLKQYTIDEQKKVTEIADQLIDEDDRRSKGDYYTPEVWVKEAHKLLDRNLESNWRSNYMVWDCAWGTGNLTRDCTKLNGTYIDDLYCSTLYDTDIDIGERYNANATKFQYDFLNDDVEEFQRIELLCKMHEFKSANAVLFSTKLYREAPGLIDGLLGINGKQRKKLLFLINPPYANTGNGDSDGSSKKGSADTLVKKVMVSEKIGACSSELFAQFLFRILKIKHLFNADVSIGIFSKANYITNESYKTLRHEMEKVWGIKEAFMLQASQFADVSGAWGVLFALITSGNNMSSTEISIMQNNGGKAIEICKKILYNNDKNIDCNKWIQEPLKNASKTKDALYISSALNVQKTPAHNAVVVDSIGGLSSDTAVVGLNTQYTSIGSAMFGAAKSKNVNKSNFDRVVSFFTARRLITGQYANWMNDKDSYMIPNTSHILYKQYQADCIVYSIFNVCSYQSSLRCVEYNNKVWNVQNEFFWLPVKYIADLALGKTSQVDFNEAICDDIEKFGDERFVYEKLQTVSLSDDAKLVLELATGILRDTFKYREEFNRKHPEYHINTWDAGWYQIKAVAKEYMKDRLEQFEEAYKAFSDRLRPLVYELGFLYK